MRNFKKLCLSNLHLLITIGIVFIVLTSFNNENGFHFNDKTVIIKNAIPQGWAFFTRNARENEIMLYKFDKNKLRCINTSSSLNLYLIFGLKRNNRRVSFAMGSVFSTPVKWRKFTNNEEVFADKNFNTFRFGHNSDSKLKTGNYVAVSEERIPWAWASNFKSPKKYYYKFTIK
ncbi:SdpA family antimicrobial peptide system protein [Halpernia frigidisoli]|nr:SdpA family antimicrobial peptide system protein [Halpernia frigidisoli]